MPSSKLFFLEKLDGDVGFGFRLLHRPGDAHMLIDNVKPNTPASRCGLEAGMFLVGVNSTSVLNKSLAEVTALIKSISGDRLTFECCLSLEDIYGNAGLEGSRTASVSSSSSSVSNRTPGEPAVTALMRNETTRENKETRSPSNSAVAGSVSFLPGAEETKRPASSSTSSEVVPTVLQVRPAPSGSTSSSTGKAVVAPKVTPVFVAPPPSQVQQARQHFQTDDQPDTVIFHHLKKWRQKPEFGFAVQRTAQGPHTLVRIEKNLPAYCSGIRDGMVLCKVNSQPVGNMPLSETAELIKESGDEVRIAVISKDTFAWLERCGVRFDDCFSDLQKEFYDSPPELPTIQPPNE